MRGPSLEILYEALATEFGVVLKTDNPGLVRSRLYALRKQSKDPDLDCLVIAQSPDNPGQELWIHKKKERPGEA